MALALVSMMNKKNVELYSLKQRDIQPDKLAVKSDLPQLKDVPVFNRWATKFSNFKDLQSPIRRVRLYKTNSRKAKHFKPWVQGPPTNFPPTNCKKPSEMRAKLPVEHCKLLSANLALKVMQDWQSWLQQTLLHATGKLSWLSWLRLVWSLSPGPIGNQGLCQGNYWGLTVAKNIIQGTLTSGPTKSRKV
jgi:hypothetical protein